MLGAGMFLAATAIGLLGTRGLELTITNRTGSPMIDVRVAYPGGISTIPRLEGGSSVSRTIRTPLAGLWGRSREVPLSWTFALGDDRSRPFEVRCDLEWWGKRRVALEARPDAARGISAGAVVGVYHFDLTQFCRSALDPRTGPRRYRGVRYHGYRCRVITWTDWADEVRNAAEWGASLSVWIAFLSTNPPLACELLEEMTAAALDASRPSTHPPHDFRLPFRDLDAAVNDTHSELVQSPLAP